MEFIHYFFMAVFFAFSLMHIRNAVRSFVTSKKTGILKIRFDYFVMFFCTIVCIASTATAVNRFSAAKDYLERAKAYEQILNIGDSVLNNADNYQAISASTESRIKIKETIQKMRDNAENLNYMAWYMIAFAAFNFTWIFSSILYFTEEGVVSSQFKIPEPFAVEFRNGTIEVFIKADLKKNKTVWSFKGTPKNMAVFGRFAVSEEPVLQTAGEVTPPPDSNNIIT